MNNNNMLPPPPARPLVSVLIPAWNVAPWLAECLDSVLAQSMADFECIIVDDGSTDTTLQVIQSFTDPRIRLIHQENAGVSAARNRALDEAKGQFIAFLDADDLWEFCFLEKLLAALEQNPGADLAFCRTGMFMDSTNRVKRQPWTNVHATGNVWWDMLLNPVFCMGAWLARKEALTTELRFLHGVGIAEDRDFLLRLLADIYAQRNRTAVALPERLHWYRQRTGSGARQIEAALGSEWALMAAHLEHPGVPEKTRKLGFSNLAFKMSVLAAFGKKDFPLALSWYAKALRLNPLNLNLYWLPLRKLAFSMLPQNPAQPSPLALSRRKPLPPLSDAPPAVLFSLVVATYTRQTELKRLLDSLAKQTLQNFEVILVDQNAPGFLAPLFERHSGSFPLKIIPAPPKGVSIARNIGLAEARGEIIAFPDDDCWYVPHTLERIAAIFAAEPVLGGLLAAWSDTPAPAAPAAPLSPINKLGAFRHAGTLVQFYRREIIEDIRFDPELGPGTGLPYGCGEDTDFLLQVLKKDVLMKRTPEVLVCHPKPDFTAVGLTGKNLAYAAGRMHLLRKHRFPLWFKLANILYPLAALPVETLRHGRGAAKYRWSMFLGRLQGFFS